MSDFYLDFRAVELRCPQFAADSLKYYDDLQVSVFNEQHFSLVLTRCDDLKIWGPYRPPGRRMIVALAGRVSLEEAEWAGTRQVSGPGGLACKAVYQRYCQHGQEALRSLNGNFTIVIYDGDREEVLIVTDRCGAAPAFQAAVVDRQPVFSSHPDLLAAALNASEDLDLTSLTEFLSSGKVSFPYTYYRPVRSLPHATVVTVNLAGEGPPVVGQQRYFEFTYQPRDQDSAAGLAEELGHGFQAAMRRRTVPRLGRPVVALSGGLDSRTILRAIPAGPPVTTICFFDQENAEAGIARRIAAASGATFVPLERKFEHYGDSATAGVRISGGMASLASNHFLGFRDRLRELEAGSLLTGCYCDYLFKGLALNRRVHPLWRTERLAPFGPEWYRPYFPATGPGAGALAARWGEIYPPALQAPVDDAAHFQLEVRRMFPLAYEPDHTQRMIPQRVLPWYVPVVDQELTDVYLRLPVRLKLNATLFARMVERVCGPEVAAIPDSNTWAPVNAARPRVLFELYRRAFLGRLQARVKPSMATTGSWPNWQFYVAHSQVLRRLWSPTETTPRGLLTDLAGFDPFAQPPEFWLGGRLELFLRLLTLKIWLEVRIRR
jgi:asparagine synthase (glutamine-hydrolysing)